MNERDNSGEDPTCDGEGALSTRPDPAQPDETEPADDEFLDGYQPV